MFQRHLIADEDVAKLADAVAAVLDKVGVLCQNDELLKGLEKLGACVDYDASIATFPPAFTHEFAESLRNESRDCEAPDVPFRAPGLPSLGTQVAQFFYDLGAGQQRPGNREDFIYLVKLGEVLHGDSGVGHSLLLTDVPPMLEPLEAAAVLAEYSTKPGPAFAWNASQVEYLVEMGDIIGIADWFSWGAACFAHPLRFDKDVADRFVQLVRKGRSAGITSMAVAGATAPVTVAGYVAVAAAEIVATWMAARAINDRAPLHGSLYGGSMDMRTGAVSYSCFDAMIRTFTVVEFVRKWCGIRIGASSGEYCSSRKPGLYTAVEKLYKAMMIAAFTGQHPGIGQGMFDDGKIICPAQLLLEREMGLGLRCLESGFKIDEQMLGLDEIVKIGFGLQSNYIESEHTLRHFREALWCPEILDRSGWDGPDWEAALMNRFQKKADELVSSYRKPEKDADKLSALRNVIDKARRDLL